jgi:hypothetical protein
LRGRILIALILGPNLPEEKLMAVLGRVRQWTYEKIKIASLPRLFIGIGGAEPAIP